MVSDWKNRPAQGRLSVPHRLTRKPTLCTQTKTFTDIWNVDKLDFIRCAVTADMCVAISLWIVRATYWCIKPEDVYYQNFPDDSFRNKLLGMFLMISSFLRCLMLDSIRLLCHWIGTDSHERRGFLLLVKTHSLINAGSAPVNEIRRFGSGFGDVTRLGEVHISPLDVPIFCGIIAAIVQFFFAYRIFTLKRSYLWICILIILVRISLLYPRQISCWANVMAQTSTLQITAAFATGYRVSFFHFHVLQ